MEELLICLDIILLSFPLIYVLFYDLQEKPSFYKTLKIYLFGIAVAYLIQVILGVYFGLFSSLIVSYLAIIFLFTSIALLVRLEHEEIENRLYLLFAILYLLVLIMMVYSIFFTPLRPESAETIVFTSEDSFLVLVSLMLALLIPSAILFITHKRLLKRAREKEISEKDLKIITYYLAIFLVIFFSFSIISFVFSFDLSVTFSGDGFLDNEAAEKINTVFMSIFIDPLFIFTAILTMLGALTRVIGRAEYEMAGNMVMAFMPMLLWLMTWFGDTPQDLVDLFMGIEMFAKVFQIYIVTMMLIIILSAWRLFTGVTAWK